MVIQQEPRKEATNHTKFNKDDHVKTPRDTISIAKNDDVEDR